MDCVTQVPGTLTSTGAQPTEGGRIRIQVCVPLSPHSLAPPDLNAGSATVLYSYHSPQMPLALYLLQQVVMIPISRICRSMPLISSLDPGCTFTRVNTLLYELSSVIPFECAICPLLGALIHTQLWEVDMLRPDPWKVLLNSGGQYEHQQWWWGG